MRRAQGKSKGYVHVVKARIVLLTLCVMDKGGLFVVEVLIVQTLGSFRCNVEEQTVRRNDILMIGGRRRGTGHCKLGKVSAGGGRAPKI